MFRWRGAHVPEIIQVPISDLLLDSENARLLDSANNQQQTALALAKDQGESWSVLHETS
jgi:hypothetical protein